MKTLMSILFPLITYPYASRVLGAAGIGQYNFSYSVIGYFQLFASLGISTYAIAEGVKIRDDREKINQFATEILFINIVSTVLSYLGLIICIYCLKGLTNYRQILLVFSLSISFAIFGIEWIYGIYEEYQYITFRAIAFQIISLIALFMFVKNENDVLKYVLISVISTGGSAILNLVHSRKYVSFKFSPKIFLHLKSYLKPVLVIFGMSVSSIIYVNSDIIMLGLIQNDIEVGLYSTAVKISHLCCTLISSLSAVLLPRLSFYIGLGDTYRFENLVKKTINFMLFLIFPGAIGLFLFSRETVLLVSGTEYLGAVTATKIMAFNLLLSPINGFISYQLFMPCRKEKIAFYATLIGALVNICLNLILIPKYSLNGAAIATITAELMVLIVCISQAKKIVNICKILKEAYQYIIASSSIVFIYFVSQLLNFTNIYAETFCTVSVSIILYGGILIALKNELILGLIIEGKKFFLENNKL